MTSHRRDAVRSSAAILTYIIVAYSYSTPAAADFTATRESVIPEDSRLQRVVAASEEACLAHAKHFTVDHGRHPSATPDADKMLYFLHIPRTAGRTYHSCFLKQAHPPSKRCAKSYDVLRLNESMSTCGLLSSHDDYSVIDMLPENGAVITQLREPVDRVLSAYEFATEVAARAAKKRAPPPDPTKTDTRNVWPWSYLVPFLEREIWSRLPAASKAAELVPQADKPINPYANDITMPLWQFLRHPDVEDVLYNGATLQVLGLTNYSMWRGAAELRHCLPHSPAAQKVLLDLALERLDHFVHVGIFDRLEDSIVSLAATLGISMEGDAWSNKVPEAATPKTPGDRGRIEQRLRDLGQQHQGVMRGLEVAEQTFKIRSSNGHSPASIAKVEGNLDRLRKRRVEIEREQMLLKSQLSSDYPFQWQSHWDEAYQNQYPLWRSYHLCVDGARKRNAQRRANSFKNLDLPDGRHFHFSRELRETLDSALLSHIREKNAMDAALYERGRQLLEAKLEQHRQQGRLSRLPSKEEANLAEMMQREHDMFHQDGQPGSRQPGTHHHHHQQQQRQQAQPSSRQHHHENRERAPAGEPKSDREDRQEL